jgi:hypothetical protein
MADALRPLVVYRCAYPLGDGRENALRRRRRR